MPSRLCNPWCGQLEIGRLPSVLPRPDSSLEVGMQCAMEALEGPSRLSRRYWQSRGPKPEEEKRAPSRFRRGLRSVALQETVEGTVVPGRAGRMKN